MTGNQIRYAEHLETKRSNLAREYETYRSNLARETETHRSNVAYETETNRHNLATEDIGRNQARASLLGAYAAHRQADNAAEANRLQSIRIQNDWNLGINKLQNDLYEIDTRKTIEDNKLQNDMWRLDLDERRVNQQQEWLALGYGDAFLRAVDTGSRVIGNLIPRMPGLY
nr:ORF1 [Mute swan feces associated picobirnavirus B]